ncbi:glycoside hydrolase family 29 protein [Botryobasidium botryosum FD-172 SS1]|uniref:alpha-L-fucosidase n=1 Tax=Botryobasidium botryosum (strain FD-172 SS1) TaxID=930990 RepID=A0A067N2A4_BOTB1|nr:glycoside hydrolase family 29 protein [Botryobasidium botryosum FD-172 SS1]
MIGDQKAYAIEITVANGLPSALSADPRFWVKSPLYVSYDSSSFRTVQMGIIHRIMPSDEVRVKVWAVPTQPGYQTVLGGSSAITVIDARGDIVVQQAEVPTTLASSERYDTPEWWDDAKFGIFIHWGVFSVPGWGPVGRYTEWYDWWLHADGKSSESWNYHRDMYGEDFVYDDFIPQFTASKFNASEWVHLFANAGAKYFVLVTKHHDGFALFDTANSTHRSSYHLGPKRDFVKELFASAKSERPGLHRGTYYSMPEWFNPDAGSYGFGNWPGHLARSPYNNKLEPYTGRIEGKDYLQEIQLAHMMALAKDYETEIMWCDIGGPNLTVQFAREWYPYAESQGRQVIMNNRCGALPQFDTPEYARFSSIQNGKWETSEGIDPYSYGYNRRTKAEDYRSASTIITTLVDIVSKNGNYLLNIGPTGEGEIIKPMVDRLLEVGKWLAHSGECIYGTDYFFLGAESGDIRFTRTPTTFCIIALSRPQNGMLVVQKSVPVLPGDEIELLGAGEDGRRLHQENRKV